MEVVPKVSNFIEKKKKKSALQIPLHKRHTPTPSSNSTSPLHSLRSKAYRAGQYQPILVDGLTYIGRAAKLYWSAYEPI